MSSVLFDEKLFQIKEEISDEEKENDENTGYSFSEDIFFLSCWKHYETKLYLAKAQRPYQDLNTHKEYHSIKSKVILNT